MIENLTVNEINLVSGGWGGEDRDDRPDEALPTPVTRNDGTDSSSGHGGSYGGGCQIVGGLTGAFLGGVTGAAVGSFAAPPAGTIAGAVMGAVAGASANKTCKDVTSGQ